MFLKVFLWTLVLAAVIGFLVFRYFLHADLANNCFIRINPSWMELSNSSIKDAINVLKTASPDDYKNLCSSVEVIDPNPSCGGVGGSCLSADYRFKTIDISSSINHLALTTAMIAYEACQAKKSSQTAPVEEEDDCSQVQNDVLSRITEF